MGGFRGSLFWVVLSIIFYRDFCPTNKICFVSPHSIVVLVLCRSKNVKKQGKQKKQIKTDCGKLDPLFFSIVEFSTFRLFFRVAVMSVKS